MGNLMLSLVVVLLMIVSEGPVRVMAQSMSDAPQDDQGQLLLVLVSSGLAGLIMVTAASAWIYRQKVAQLVLLYQLVVEDIESQQKSPSKLTFPDKPWDKDKRVTLVSSQHQEGLSYFDRAWLQYIGQLVASMPANSMHETRSRASRILEHQRSQLAPPITPITPTTPLSPITPIAPHRVMQPLL